ncbi:hypothetical protein FHR32_001008 [Streptosporangium album]|uniref:Uncharacterized protein n=1 Tax=Streptosporangium album TaxID=47479 RepID=A0A7W7W7D2_9ACTN|nr:hypothetical protein [Streptosporangium album]MBB4936703.1 hypothetical protein [Streptosporangium album]
MLITPAIGETVVFVVPPFAGVSRVYLADPLHAHQITAFLTELDVRTTAEAGWKA